MTLCWVEREKVNAYVYCGRNQERTNKRDRRLAPILNHYLEGSGIEVIDPSCFGFLAILPMSQQLIWFGSTSIPLPESFDKYLSQLRIMKVNWAGNDKIKWTINGKEKENHIKVLDRFFAGQARPLGTLQFDSTEPDVHMAWSGYIRKVGQACYDIDLVILRENQSTLWAETKYISAPDAPVSFQWAEKKYGAKGIVIQYKLELDNFKSMDHLPWEERVVLLRLDDVPISCRYGIKRDQLAGVLVSR